MSRKHIAIFSALISLLFVSVIWQVAETQILSLLGQGSAKLLGRSFSTYDEDGIPMQETGKQEPQYDPLIVARAAHEADLKRRLDGNEADFILLTDWLLAQLNETDFTCTIDHSYDLPKYAQKAPWQSALSQAVLMNVLVARAGMQRDLEIYSKAQRTLNSLNPQAAGLTHALSDSSYWYMQYPSAQPYYLLSGMMGVLIEIQSYYEQTRDPFAKSLYYKGLNALKEKLPEFDYHGYSYYDLKGHKASRAEHQNHIKQLTKLLEFQEDSQILQMRNRWQKADSYFVLWQMAVVPQPWRILVFALAFLAMWLICYLILASTQRKEPFDPEHSSS